ncbi:type I restriction enzyme HsdR N-terminal domain-containing protein [Cognataquiflexum rubidum]|uniref:type I restriction enzyme HsdR N-terminal domain-containing protein n=1 Tax=Cognataquiflexum rubidum TaxID=2922273 RepID=UPI001F13F465|nr:type I restriction enzyme HsdR N-terminal domain-containing protein [Cognataquiflexum rubidum]MCH6232316.1 type I restriction enzyme HsdR N-terminal domain-containing protein [Cognataquiflexum rubidum]
MMADRYGFMQFSLNFPEFEFKIQESEGKLSIFDSLRKKYLILTPEEWVRQHMVSFLVHHRNYPKGLFSLEKEVIYNSLQKRFDILVLDRVGNPFLLIECKAPEVRLSKKTVEQVAVYNKTIGASYMGISNGRQHLFLKYNSDVKNYDQISDLPQFQP